MKISQETFKRYYRKYKGDRERLAADFRGFFADPQNIVLFGWFCFPHHLKEKSPKFHEQLMELVNLPTNVGIAAPRGHAKSTMVNLVYLAWLIVNRRLHFIIPISDTYSQSVEFVNTLKQELTDNPMIKWLYGDLQGDVWQDGRFITSTGIKVTARAYGMKIRGLKFRQYRPELLLFDDLENDESVQNIEQREKLKNWFTRAALPALARDGRAVIIGTILHGDSLLMNIINKQGEFAGWTTKLYKAININDDGDEYSLWPSMYSVQELKDMRDNPNCPNYKGSLVFAQEYQNEPIDEMDAIIRKTWIDIVDKLPVMPPIMRGFACDPAISKADQADFFAKARGFSYFVIDPVSRVKELHIMITQIGNDRFSFKQGIEDIERWYKQEKTDFVAIEEVAFQEAYASSITVPARSIKPDKDKRRRTLAVSKFFEAGRIHFLGGITNLTLAIDQLTHFPSVAHDDICDAIVYLIECLMFGGSLPSKTADDIEKDEEVKPATYGVRDMRF